MTTTPPPSHPLTLDPKHDDYDFPTTAPDAKTGHPGHTTPEQDAQIYQLRTILEQLGYTERLDTLTLLRFLRARKFDVEAAKLMYVYLSPVYPFGVLERMGWGSEVELELEVELEGEGR